MAIVAESDEAAKAKQEDLLLYSDREGVLALSGGWTGIDLSKHIDGEGFRFIGLLAVQSDIERWASTCREVTISPGIQIELRNIWHSGK